MDRFEAFRIFVRVAETQSFTKAAAQLNLPRSTLSTAVQALEARVGQRLLNRTTRSVRPTAEGEAMLARCTRLLADLDDTENLFRNDGAPTGILRVTMPTRIGHLVVTPELPRFIEQNPSITIELTSTDRRRELDEDDIDCAVRVGVTHDDRLIIQMLGELEIINCASPAYLSVNGTPRSPADLSKHKMVGFIPGSAARPEAWTYRCQGKIHSEKLHMSLITDDAETYLAAALAGLGLIQVPAYDVRTLLAQRRLVEILPMSRAPSMPIAIVYPKRRYLSRPLQTFLAWVAPLLASRLELAE